MWFYCTSWLAYIGMGIETPSLFALFFSYFDTLCSFAHLFDERLLCTDFCFPCFFLYSFLHTVLRNFFFFFFCFSQIGHMALYAHHHTILSHGRLV